jgi:2-polyprenyl-3-methyl-5-hydroxy-6-metoxy-1,4-benzoquinol methylase
MAAMKKDDYYQNRRKEIYAIVPPSVNKVLEIGCAAGGFRLNFPEHVEYWGVEPVREAAEQARQKNIKVLCGIYDEVCGQVPSAYFDVVVCNDVIEHVPDPEAFLVSLKDKLTPNGVLVGSIPNVRFWGNLINLIVRRDWKYEDSGVLDRTHLRFFTAKSFRRLMHDTGYELVKMAGIESKRMKALKVLFSPFLLLAGFDVCDMQFMFKARCGKIEG